jgi:hypothetical protein
MILLQIMLQDILKIEFIYFGIYFGDFSLKIY